MQRSAVTGVVAAATSWAAAEAAEAAAVAAASGVSTKLAVSRSACTWQMQQDCTLSLATWFIDQVQEAAHSFYGAALGQAAAGTLLCGLVIVCHSQGQTCHGAYSLPTCL
ncbi:hypothetical protein COO60DRAFT_1513265, partial [Scenedesmus sp. NREL 46B-D3]